MLTTAIVVVFCSPFIWIGSLGIKREYSVDFWIRSIVIGQFLFWVGLFIAAAGSSYGLIQTFGDFLGVAFNFLIATPATALMIRTSMRFRASRNAPVENYEDPKDRLDGAFSLGKTLKKWSMRLANLLSRN
jgi:hypothetical protein